MMKRTAVYIHGKGGNAAEADHYRQLFPSWSVVGIDYKNSVPWKAGQEIKEEISKLKADSDKEILIADIIGAFFAMNANIEREISHAYFISPIVDMEKLITDMMGMACITEAELKEKGIIRTDFGEDLSWEYLCYVRENSLRWNVPTDILYGSEDCLTSFETIKAFAQNHQANLTVLNGGEHWFHTETQMQFLDKWITDCVMKEGDSL